MEQSVFYVPVVPKPVIPEVESCGKDALGERYLDPIGMQAVSGKTLGVVCKHEISSGHRKSSEICRAPTNSKIKVQFLPAGADIEFLNHASCAASVAVMHLRIPLGGGITGKPDSPVQPESVFAVACSVYTSSKKSSACLGIDSSFVGVAPERQCPLRGTHSGHLHVPSTVIDLCSMN